ncbi:MAG: SpoIIE family protein phosphatase, partial [Verrucomicrobiota bacterium]|nr:SpoIIE family protein phosphatase [Verrucomicrobiota bacterium]
FLLYTDGLIGAQTEPNRLTPAKLTDLLQTQNVSAEMLLAHVVHEATSGNGDKPLPDDIAAVAVKRLGATGEN